MAVQWDANHFIPKHFWRFYLNHGVPLQSSCTDYFLDRRNPQIAQNISKDLVPWPVTSGSHWWDCPTPFIESKSDKEALLVIIDGLQALSTPNGLRSKCWEVSHTKKVCDHIGEDLDIYIWRWFVKKMTIHCTYWSKINCFG